MTRKTMGIHGLPSFLKDILKELGRHIKLARKRRGMTMQDMAERMFVTRKTLNRLESGDPGVSLGILASALLALGMERDLEKLVDPETDRVGNMIDRTRYEKQRRTIRPKPIDTDF